MKKALAWLLVVALTAAISIGATLAYLTDTDEDVNVMTVGQVKIDQLEYERIDVESADDKATVQEFHNNKPLFPAVTDKEFDYTPGTSYVDWEQIGKDGYTSTIWDPTKINNELDKMVFVKNTGDYDAYVRTVFGFEANGFSEAEFKELFHLNLNDQDWTWEWTGIQNVNGTNYFVVTATYQDVLAPGAITPISLSQVALDSKVTNEDIAGFGDTYQILVQSQAVQAAGFDAPATALNEAFGTIPTAKGEYPFEDDNPINGTNLYNALHYKDADGATDITSQVNTVTFGLNKDYPSVVNSYDGFLIDQEQDTKAYAYYVPANGGYDVYVLSNSEIYAPANSANLFAEMSNLTSVNMSNLDTSRMEDSMRMFRNCTKLTTLDTTGWDTSKVNSMNQMFSGCSVLAEIKGVENWNTSSCTNMMGLFYNCNKIDNLNLKQWDVSEVDTMRLMFGNCSVLKNLDTTGWDASKVTNMNNMFFYCHGLEKLDLSSWKVSSVQILEGLVYGCSKVKSVSIKGWDTSNATTFKWMFGSNAALEEIDATGTVSDNVTSVYCMFLNDSSLKSIKGSGAWNFSKVTDVQWLFQNCSSLPYVDATNWDLSNAVDASGMFFNCLSLETVEGSENWDLGKATTMYCMFYANHKLRDLDVSGWDTSSVTSMDSMFRGTNNLAELNVTNWDVSNVVSFRSMFSSFKGNAGDIALESLDMSKWYAPKAEDISYMFYGCSKLKSLDFSSWKTTKIKYMGHTFSDCWDLENINFSGWNTSNLITMDATFNNCESVKVLDLSMFDMSSMVELTQTFEYCYSLEKIIGIETWVTPNLRGMEQMFSSCSSLKELDLSGFDTRNVGTKVPMVNGSTMTGFGSTFSGLSSLQKLVLGENFDFNGDGTLSADQCVKLPNPAFIDGQATKWYNAANDTYYTGAEIPEPNGAAATYVAAIPPANP